MFAECIRRALPDAHPWPSLLGASAHADGMRFLAQYASSTYTPDAVGDANTVLRGMLRSGADSQAIDVFLRRFPDPSRRAAILLGVETAPETAPPLACGGQGGQGTDEP